MLEEVNFLVEQALARLYATVAVPSGGYPLAGLASVTHTPINVTGLANISGFVFSDVAGTLFIEQTVDGTNYDLATQIQVLAGTATPIDVAAYGIAARARYVNGAAPQTVFRISCVARAMSGVSPSSSTLPTMPGQVLVNSAVALLGNGTLLSPIVQVIPTAAGTRYAGWDIVRGFGQSDVAGNIGVLQAATAADIVAPYTNCGIANFAVPAGGFGIIVPQLIVGPFVAALYTNGVAAQARMRWFMTIQ